MSRPAELEERSVPDDVDLKQFMSDALSQTCFGGEDEFPLEETIDRYFAPGYRQYAGTEVLDRAGFVGHMRTLRSRVSAGRVEVVDAIRQGNRIADRHRFELALTDGSTARLEVYAFGELDDSGRVVRIDAISRPLPDDVPLTES